MVKPAGTTAVPGIDAMAAALLRTARLTFVFTAAGAFSVTFPVVLRPPRIGVGETANAVSCGGSNVRLPEPV